MSELKVAWLETLLTRVPQVTIVGSLLRLLFVSVIPNLPSSSVLLCAGEIKTQKVVECKCDISEHQNDLDGLEFGICRRMCQSAS